MSNHAKLSPSSSDRWANCPGSVALCEKVPEPPASEFMLEGSHAHSVAEQALKLNLPPSDFLEGADTGMAMYVQDYIDTLNRFSVDAYRRDIEVKVPIDHITGTAGDTGTMDALMFGPGWIRGADLKFGQGVRVAAKGSNQLAMYLSGVVRKYEYLYDDLKVVKGIIIQPRLGHTETWSISMTELREIEDKLRDAAEQTRKPDAPIVPGVKQCQFCPAFSSCKVAADWVKDRTAPDANLIPAGELGPHLDVATLAKKWATVVNSRADEYAQAGGQVDGWKLVYGRAGHRKWKDNDIALDFLRKRCKQKLNDVAPRKVLSPAQSEKVVGRDLFGRYMKDHVKRPEPSLTLVPETDSRQGVTPADVLGFPSADVLGFPSADETETVEPTTGD